MKILFLYLFMGMMLIGCQSNKGPTAVLKNFLDYRFTKEQTKDEILKFVGGNLKDYILEMNDEDFQKFSDSKKIVRKKIKIKVKKCDEKKCFLTYLLSYKQDGKEGKEVFEIDVKKIAELDFDGNEWKIVNVTNVKSSIEAKKGLNVEL